MTPILRALLPVVFLLITGAASAQNTTRDENDKNTGNSGYGKGTGKILLIPFDPKLYMSEVDKKIGTENKLTFNQLRAMFRSGLDYKIATELKAAGATYSLLTDSVKNKNDIKLVYESIGYDYDKPNPDGAVTKTPVQKKEDPKIKNGQLVVEMNDEQRFMNTKIINKDLLTYLNGKYKSDVFVFINQLDIKKDPESYDITTDTYKRDVIVHYTVFDKTGKRINAGIATSSFSSTVNDPKTIINTAFTDIAKTITARVTKLVAPATETTVKDPLKQK